jgi:hypothetical protein
MAKGDASSRRRLLLGTSFGGKTGSSAVHHSVGKFAHRLLRDCARLAMSKIGFRLIDGGKDLRTVPFPLLP